MRQSGHQVGAGRLVRLIAACILCNIATDLQAEILDEAKRDARAMPLSWSAFFKSISGFSSDLDTIAHKPFSARRRLVARRPSQLFISRKHNSRLQWIIEPVNCPTGAPIQRNNPSPERAKSPFPDAANFSARDSNSVARAFWAAARTALPSSPPPQYDRR